MVTDSRRDTGSRQEYSSQTNVVQERFRFDVQMSSVVHLCSCIAGCRVHLLPG